MSPTISRRYLSTSCTSSGSFPPSDVTFHVPKARSCVRGSGRRGPCRRLPPNPHCTWPLRFPLRMVGPQEVGPTSSFRAEPGRAPWVEARPPGALLRAPTPGLAPGWGPGCAIPGDVTVLVFTFSIEAFWTAFSLVRHPRPVCLGRPYQGHEAPDNIAPRIIRTLKLPHHDKVAVREGV